MLATSMATLCAASVVTPSQPAMSSDMPKAPTSRAICTPMGAPRSTTRRTVAPAGSQLVTAARSSRRRLARSTYAAMNAAISVRAKSVAQAEPIMPISGAPHSPYTSI